MTKGRIFPLIINFTFPLMLGNLLQQTYSLIDAALVGRLLGVNSLAAVGASVSIVFLILGFCQGCCCGFAIPVAQDFGAKNIPWVRMDIHTGIRISAYMSAAMAALTALACGWILRSMKTPAEIFDEAYVYLLITFLGIPMTFFYNLFSYVLRALGDSRTPFWYLVVATVVNIVLDVVFISLLGTGVGGAALATVIAQGLSAALCYRHMRRKYGEFMATGQERRIEGRRVRRLLGLGVPIGLQFSITAIGCIVLQAANNMLGAAYVAAFAAASRIKMFFFCPLESLGVAMATFAGQNFGALEVERISRGTKVCMWLVAGYSALSFLVIFFGAEQLAMLFMSGSESEVIAYTAKYLVITTAFFPLLGSLCVFRYSIQGCNYTVMAMAAGVFEMVARSVMGIAGVPVWGFTAVCLGDPAAWVAANVFLFPAYLYVYRECRRMKERESVTPARS